MSRRSEKIVSVHTKCQYQVTVLGTDPVLEIRPILRHLNSHIRNLAYFDSHTVFIKVCNTAHKTDCRRKKPPKFVPLKLEICLNYAFNLDLCCYMCITLCEH